MNLHSKLEKLSEDFNVSEKEILTWCRSSVRSAWGDSPMKRYMEEKHKYKIINTNPKSKKRFPEVWRIRCAICGEEYSPINMELDHVDGHNSLKEFKDVDSFLNAIIFVSPDDLQWLCTDTHVIRNKRKVLVKNGCHEIKTYAERKGISFKESMVHKYAIDIIKTKKDKEFFSDRDLECPSNAEKRRIEIVKILLEELNNADTVK